MSKTYFLTLRHHENGQLEWITRPYNDDFKELQKEVGGFFDHFDIFPPYHPSARLIHNTMRIDTWINDEGKLIGLPPTIPIVDQDGEILDLIVGPICFLKSDDQGNSFGLDPDEIDIVMRTFLEVFGNYVSIRNPNGPVFIEADLTGSK